MFAELVVVYWLYCQELQQNQFIRLLLSG